MLSDFPGGILSDKLGGGVWSTFQNPYPIYSMTKISDFPFPINFTTWLKSDILSMTWHSCLKHNLWSAFADSLVGSEENLQYRFF